MTSFIELPRLAFDGRDQPSVYVNTDDIVLVTEEWDGQVRVDIRHYGTEGMHGAVRTYVPLGALLNLLGELCARPGVKSWTPEMKHGWSIPVAARLKEAADKERATR